jgi:hypothetical protein
MCELNIAKSLYEANDGCDVTLPSAYTAVPPIVGVVPNAGLSVKMV